MENTPSKIAHSLTNFFSQQILIICSSLGIKIAQFVEKNYLHLKDKNWKAKAKI
jgi:hypothetical protein